MNRIAIGILINNRLIVFGVQWPKVARVKRKIQDTLCTIAAAIAMPPIYAVA